METSLKNNRRHDDGEALQHYINEELRLLDIERNIKSLEDKIDTLSTDVADLVTAWKATSWLVSLAKLVGGLAVAATAIIVLLKAYK